MKRTIEVQACGLEQILLFSCLIVIGLLPTFHFVWGEDAKTFVAPPAVSTPAPATADVEPELNVDQIYATLRFFSVPTDLVASTVADWVIAPFDQKQLAAADPFAAMNQPLRRHNSKSGDQPLGQVTAGTEMRLPSIHKILNSQEAQQLLERLEQDERTTSVFSPQLAFIDGTTATAVVGEKTPFVVGWKDNLPQTRVVPKGKMVRLRTVLDEDKMWLDYEILVSRILDVTTQSIRVANRPHPIKLAVPHVQTTKAGATVELPVGATLLIGGLPAESKDGDPRQLLVLLRAGPMRGFQMRKTANTNADRPQQLANEVASEPSDLQIKETPPPTKVAEKRKLPFSLISRILNREPRQTSDDQKPMRVFGGVK